MESGNFSAMYSIFGANLGTGGGWYGLSIAITGKYYGKKFTVMKENTNLAYLLLLGCIPHQPITKRN